MKSQYNKYHREVLRAMANIDDFLIDHVWTIFQNLDDTDDPQVVEAVLYMMSVYDFDIDVLPQSIYDAVVGELKQNALESYA